ncbi:MAG TPA: DUF1844 domain-containing protein [Polyangiales bacterium]|nr:DUF1844 domain-containing protein [Polyangiales bacterium]
MASDKTTQDPLLDPEDEGSDRPEADIPPMGFDIFVLSLNASALIHLGEAPEQQGGKRTVNLPMARQSIDILGLLEEKTRGNLSGEEERLLHDILFDLRMRYARAKG